MKQKLQTALRIPRATIDKLRQGRTVSYTAEDRSIYIDEYWISTESLALNQDGTKVLIPPRKLIIDFTVTLKRDKSRGRKPTH